jgi:small subunit ribosomal protein S7e
MCPRSHILTAVHNTILKWIFPSERGSMWIWMVPGSYGQSSAEQCGTQSWNFSGVYKKLTGKDVNFEFPEFQ